MKTSTETPAKTLKTVVNGVVRDATLEETEAFAEGQRIAAKMSNGGTHGPVADLADLSPSRRLLARLSANKVARTTPVEVELIGETLYVRKLNTAEFQQVSMLANRQQKGYLNPFAPDQITDFYAAVLFVAVTMDAVGDVPFFDTYELAYNLTREVSVEAREVVDTLIAKIISINPDLMKVRVLTPQERAAMQDAEKKESSAG